MYDRGVQDQVNANNITNMRNALAIDPLKIEIKIIETQNLVE